MSEVQYTPSELRKQIRTHLWGLTEFDESALGSIDFSDFLIDQLVQAVEELTIYGYRGDLMAENMTVSGDGSVTYDYDGIGQMVVGEEDAP